MVNFRRCSRSATRRLNRALNRGCVRTLSFASREDYIAQELAALNRAIRAHRRLAKLAPRLFDFAIVSREWSERLARIPREMEIERALNKIYGEAPPDPGPSAHSNDWDSPIPKSPRTLRAMELAFAEWKLWMDVAREKRELFQRRRPHALIPLPRLARLCELGCSLGRLAAGLPEFKTGRKCRAAESNKDRQI